MSELKDYLLDIVKATTSLGGQLTGVRVEGTDKETKIESVNGDRTLIMLATANAPVEEFKGLFGIPNLTKLGDILNFEEYKDAKGEIVYSDRGGEKTPTTIRFTNADGDFTNEHRLVNHVVVQEKMKSVSIKKLPEWVIEFEPVPSVLSRLAFQSNLLNENEGVTLYQEDDKLMARIGDNANHLGQFVMASGFAKKKFTVESMWVVKQILPILKLSAGAGHSKVRLSNNNLMEIEIDTGLINYRYYAFAKAT